LLHIQHLRIKRQAKHPVRFEPKGCFEISRRQGDIIIGNVGAGKRIIFATYFLQGLIITLNVPGAAKHQVFKQMRKACTGRIFIARPNIIENIDSCHGGAGVLVDIHL